MPRRQLDITKDLFIAFRDDNREAFLQHADEYVRYLNWKKFGKKALEFEEIVTQIKQKIQHKDLAEPFGDKNIELTLFGDEIIKKQYPKPVKSANVWQISRGAVVDFMPASVLLEYCIDSKRKHFSNSEFPAVIGYAPEKSEGFTRILYFLGLLDDKTKAPSGLARLMMQNDKYFEEIGTLWFLHYFISSDSRLIIWNRIANHLFGKQSFNYEDTVRLLEDQKQFHALTAFSQHLRKEFNTCIKAYTESNFSKLNIFSFNVSSSNYDKAQPYHVPDEILLASIWLFKKRYFPSEVTLEIKTLANAENSPGRLFYLSERYFRDALDRLRVKGYIAIESLADLDQIKFTQFKDYLEVLNIYYNQKLS